MSNTAKIQLITNRLITDIKYCKINKISQPEAFEDYEINVIDLGSSNIWENKGCEPIKINEIKDIEIFTNMVKSTANSILIILPQNIKYHYMFTKGIGYTKEEELKNLTSLIENILKKFIKSSNFENFIFYNKTSTKINQKEINSDFVLQNLLNFKTIMKASNKRLITTNKLFNIYFTTLDLSFNNFEYLIDYLKEIGLLTTTNDNEPDWFKNLKYFNDDTILTKQIELKNEILSLNEKTKENEKILSLNNFYKSIVYKSGDNLVEVVNKMLDEMIEYDYKSFKDIKEEDFLIEKYDCVFIGEIKGINTNVKRANISQVANHRDFYLDIEGNENKNVIPILIINRLRERPIEERDDVAEDVIKLAEIYNVLIITSEIFLKLYEYFKLGKISKEEIINLLKSKTGILKLSDFIN